MHSTSTKFTTVFDTGVYNQVWEIDVIPDYNKTAQLTLQPFAKNRLVSHVPDLVSSPLKSETFFECNTSRNGTMYFLSNTAIDKAARSSEYAKSDCTFDNPLTVTIQLGQKDGTLLDYRSVGFATDCKNGDYATAFDITYYHNGGAKNVSIIDYTESTYMFPDVNITLCNKVVIKIIKWSRSDVRAVVSRIYIDAVPFSVGNDEITAAPNTFKELESDSQDGVGSLSSNQISFSFYNINKLNESSYQTGAKLIVRHGISDENWQEVLPYGQYYIKSASCDKSIIKITAEDDLSGIISKTACNFTDTLNDIQRSYLQFADKMFTGIVTSGLSSDYTSALGIADSKGVKVLRGVGISDIANEFCILTGTCINYDDDGNVHLYQRYGGASAHTVPDENIIRYTRTIRKIPDIITITANTWHIGGSICYTGDNITIPPFSIAGSNVYPMSVAYDDQDKKIAIEPHTRDVTATGDVLYDTNAEFRRQLYNIDGDEIDNDFEIDSTATVIYDGQIILSKKYGTGKTEFVINTYIVPIKTYADFVNYQQIAPVAMSIYQNANQWIYDWIVKTRYEHIFEIITDPRIEIGDVITIGGITGTVYRIEVNGSIMKTTLRSEQNDI